MRARFVNETINFERGIDPKDAMHTGARNNPSNYGNSGEFISANPYYFFYDGYGEDFLIDFNNIHHLNLINWMKKQPKYPITGPQYDAVAQKGRRLAKKAGFKSSYNSQMGLQVTFRIADRPDFKNHWFDTSKDKAKYDWIDLENIPNKKR